MRILLLALLVFGALLPAEEWIDFSAPVAGAGGAGIGLGRGPTAAYYNPANAASRPGQADLLVAEFHMPAHVSGSIQGQTIRFMFDTAKFANDLFDRFEDGAFAAGGGLDNEDITFAFKVFDALDQLQSFNGDGIYATTAVGFGARFRGLFLPRDGISINIGGFGVGGATPIVDLQSFRNFRLTDEAAADWEALVNEAINNSGGGSPAPTTSAGQAFSLELQARGYGEGTADALAAWAEDSGLNLQGETADILLDFLENTLNGDGESLESGANPLAGNESGFLIRGLAYYEIGVNYGFGVPIMGSSDWLSLGVGVKFYQAYLFSELLLVENMTKNGVNDTLRSLGEQLRDAYTLRADTARTNVGIDLGVIFTPQLPIPGQLLFAVTGRNLNSPEFRWKKNIPGEPRLIRLDPQVRVAAAYTVFQGIGLPLSVGVEADLNRTTSHVLPGYHQQFIRAGVTFEPAWGGFGLGLRAGFFRNIADAGQAVVFTGGVGLKLFVLHLDFAGHIGLDSRNFGPSDDFEVIPQRFGGSVQLSLRVGF